MTSFSSSFIDTSSSSSMMVTQEEFNAFHKIDRSLFTRLILGLNRDINQSFEIVGFLFLLEQTGYARNLISHLISLQDAFIEAVANETLVCLSVLYNEAFSSTFFDDDFSVIPLIISVTGGRLTLRFIHQNRETFLFGLRKNLKDICYRAFQDICVKVERILALEREKTIEELKKIRLSVQQENPSRLSVQQENPNRLSVQQERAFTTPYVEETHNIFAVADTKKSEEEEEDGVVVVAADDRTVFLTFSKGYPISEEEVRVYFTRRFGEVIETIEMQEVEEKEQPLYARMVLWTHCMDKLEEIVSVRNRNKFTIDGKHVWARKYVRKNPSSSSHI
ncbi:unnamed protein product [Cochlearia groenlandica]